MAPKSSSKSAATRPGGKAGGKSGGSAKQRARAAKAVAAAQAARSRRNTVLVTTAVCVVIIGVIIGAVIFAVYKTNQQKNAVIKAQSVTAHYPVKIDHGTILAGKDSAKVKIDIYEDFLCPHCGELEQGYGKEMQQDLNNGSLQIRYRMVDILNQSSSPAGYSQRAANAAFASVPAGKFASYHWSLFHDQPEERGPGYTDDQLISLGQRLGIKGDAYGTFTDHVKNGTYKKYADTQAQKLASDKSLHQADGSYGTPTVVYKGKTIDTSQGWLSKLVNGG